MTKNTKNLVWLAVLTVGGFWLYSQMQGAGSIAGLGQPGWRRRAIMARRRAWLQNQGGGPIYPAASSAVGTGPGPDIFDTGEDPDAALYATLYSGED